MDIQYYGLCHQEATRLEGELARLTTASRDCAALVPGDAAGAAARTKELEAELAAVDKELADADAQHRLYTLLGERTRCASGLERFSAGSDVRVSELQPELAAVDTHLTSMCCIACRRCPASAAGVVASVSDQNKFVGLLPTFLSY